MAKRTCKGEKADGGACGAAPLRDGDHCLAHSDQDVRDSVGFGGPQPGAGRPRLPRPHEVLRERIESNIDRWLEPLEQALGAGKPLQMWDASEGRHSVQYVADPALAMKAVKLAFETVYGKPRQQIDLSNEHPDQPLRISHELLTDPEFRDGLRAVKRRLADARAERSVGSRDGD